MKEARTPNPRGREGNPISLSEYSFDDALRRILASPPAPKPDRKPKKKPAKRKVPPAK